jgi:glutathione S-transferase
LLANVDNPLEDTRVKLYYSPGACSLSPHIVAKEAGIPLTLVKVNTKTKTIKAEGDFWAVNPKGYVPALELDNGEILTEGPAIVQYLADLRPASKLAAENGSFARVRLQEALSYLTSEIHKSYSPLFKPDVSAAVREERIAYLRKRYALIEQQLEGRQYLFGDEFTAADAYLFVLTNWARSLKIDLSEFPNLLAFQKRVGSRRAVLEALRDEGLIKEAKVA